MARYSVYCEECVEEIPSDEVQWQDGRLYCARCGSEVEAPEGDVFEQILANRSGMVFQGASAEEDDLGDEEDEARGEDAAMREES